MQLTINPKSFFIFDLDDTLFREIDFLKSAYSNISSSLSKTLKLDLYELMLSKFQNRENVFRWLIEQYQGIMPELTIEWLLKEYREHMPEICLSEATAAFIKNLNSRHVPMGLITDGRGVTQRNKLKALGITDYFKDIIISEEFGSEKPDERNYLYFQNKYVGMNFYFIGDNTSKDFIVPSKLGWTTICIKDTGHHIHQQCFNNQPVPDFIIGGFEEIEII